MTSIASYPDRSLAEMAANELNSDDAPPGAPRFKASEQPDEHGLFHVFADKNLQPSQVEYFRQFLPLGGNHARY